MWAKRRWPWGCFPPIKQIVSSMDVPEQSNDLVLAARRSRSDSLVMIAVRRMAIDEPQYNRPSRSVDSSARAPPHTLRQREAALRMIMGDYVEESARSGSDHDD